MLCHTSFVLMEDFFILSSIDFHFSIQFIDSGDFVINERECRVCKEWAASDDADGHEVMNS